MGLTPRPTARLRWRAAWDRESTDDLDDLVRLYRDPEVVRHIGAHLVRDHDEARALLDRIAPRIAAYPPDHGAFPAEIPGDGVTIPWI